MARMPRGIELDHEGQYHLRGQAAGPKGHYPLQDKANAEKLLEIIRHFTALYFCAVAGLELMGSHYHLVCRFQAFRVLSQEDLLKLAEAFYPGAYKPYLGWGPADWARFNRRLFNVSELMRNIQQAFTRWYNSRNGRKGSFWADRFGSTESDNLVETVFYIELNAVRAELVTRPEQWRYSSAWMRRNREAGWLMPLGELMDCADPAQAEKLYWATLYWRGTQPSKETDALIPVELAERMAREQFERGCYLTRRDFFTRGRKIGTRAEIESSLKSCRERGIYRHRTHPLPVGVGDLYALRGVRSTYLRV